MREKEFKKKKLINELLKEGSCSPKIAYLADKLNMASSTIHYRIKKMEEEGKILGYNAIFNFKKINRGFCALALMKLDGKYYNDLGSFVKFAKKIAENEEVESVDIITGEWELLVKIRSKDQESYFNNLQKIIENTPIVKVNSLVSVKQIKSEHCMIPEDIELNSKKETKMA